MAGEQQGLAILARLAEQPAVAFYEGGVASAVTAVLKELGLGFQVDRYGNIIARVRGRSSGTVPALAFVAHMDHPGFEAVANHEGYLIGEALGGVPAASFGPGVPLQLILGDGRRLPAVTAGRHGEESERQILIQPAEPVRLDQPCPVVFDMPDFQVDGDLVRMRAADDLAGCAGILTALAGLSSQLPPGDTVGVFTRAEEVGLVGARLLAESGVLSRDTLIVSVESSRALPGGEIGGGPVIRVGDAGTTFNANAEAALMRARETLWGGPEGFRAQRQLMSGGVCEASAFARWGYRTTGIAFPLGNYHNGSPEGDVEAEYIHIDDFQGGIELMVEAVYRVPERESTNFRRRFRLVPEDLRERLIAAQIDHDISSSG
jgi:endoglucanase